MRKVMLAIMLGATTAAPVLAELKPHGWRALGTGDKSCGAWTAAETSKNDIEQISQRYWLAGFLGGFNAFGPDASGDVTAKTDSNGVTQWMDTYCAAHPLETQYQAAMHLIIELRRQ